MKALFASLFAALFALACFSSYAAAPIATGSVFADEPKDDAKTPTTETEKKNSDEDKKKTDDDDKKS